MDTQEFGRIINGLSSAIASQQQWLEKFRLELSSNDEMRERGDKHLIDKMYRGVPGRVAEEIMILEATGNISTMQEMTVLQLGNEMLTSTLRSLAIGCVALDINTARIIGADEALTDAIESMGGEAWPKPEQQDHS